MKILLCCLLATFFVRPGASTGLLVPTQMQLFEGTWKVIRADSQKPEELKNECRLFNNFFACQQSVDGSVSALIVFAVAKDPGHYFTQSVNTEGRALGKGDLQINGNRWVFSNTWDQGGKMTYYKNIYTFKDRDHIHFEQQESSNGKDWTTKNSGDETRMTMGR